MKKLYRNSQRRQLANMHKYMMEPQMRVLMPTEKNLHQEIYKKKQSKLLQRQIKMSKSEHRTKAKSNYKYSLVKMCLLI